MRLFQILSLGTELVDELFFCLITEPVYMRLYGGFLSCPMHPSLHGSLPHHLVFSPNSFPPSLLPFLWLSSAASLYHLIYFASYYFLFSTLYLFSFIFSLRLFPLIPLSLCCLFPLSTYFFLIAPTFLWLYFLTYFSNVVCFLLSFCHLSPSFLCP